MNPPLTRKQRNKIVWNAKNNVVLVEKRQRVLPTFTAYRTRSLAFLDYLETSRGLYPELLSRQTGISSAMFAKCRRGKYGFTTVMVLRLLPVCPELNLAWLFRGEGNMIRANPQTNKRKV